MSWDFVDRVTVRRVGNSFIGEARKGPHHATGDMMSNPVAAMNGAANSLDAKLRPIWEARDDFEDLL